MCGIKFNIKMSKLKIMDENEKAVLYLDSSKSRDHPKENEKVFIIYDEQENCPKSLTEAIDSIYNHRSGFSRFGDILESYRDILQEQIIGLYQRGNWNMVTSRNDKIDERESELVYGLSHNLDFVPRIPRKKKEIRHPLPSYIGNIPSPLLDKFDLFTCLEYFSREMIGFWPDREYVDWSRIKDANSFNVEVGRIATKREFSERYMGGVLSPGKPQWHGLDIWFPDMGERFERIKTYQKNFWPEEVKGAFEDFQKFKDWLVSLK
jgi:hypothetical protein